MNAILQALLNMHKFKIKLHDPKLLQSVTEPKSLYRALVGVFNERENWEMVSPTLLKECVAATSQKFRGNEQQVQFASPSCSSPTLQQDAHEFLIELLDTLQAEIDAAIKDQSIIPGLFGYEVLHTIRCNACDEESTNKECSIGMSLDIQDR